MELKLAKTMSCRVAARGRWGNSAAAFMGLSFFLRMVYYFGLMNFNDLPVFEIVFRVALPLLVSIAFILMLKVKALNLPIVAGVICAVFAVNYFFAENMSFGGILSGVLVLAMAVLIVGAVLGYVPERKWLLWAGTAVLAFRVLFVDLFGYLLPLSELKLVAYIPMASNLFGVAAVCFLCSALRLRKAE